MVEFNFMKIKLFVWWGVLGIFQSWNINVNRMFCYKAFLLFLSKSSVLSPNLIKPKNHV
ncbi:hypothetical protein N475_10790 [Pseudoalteromonas luteoviolacea DSM 6061]|uniref:Uncharacterized protein n=1 Tax=Pseudoalteromonas luteoviolacea DSM 6061 TaxID=1365250 RepID=A0A166XYT3_9GAMM|nr:hypothetical protein N475_10790 [Pseudoalteromonas luteoviolacea DSM 6061]